MPPGALAAGFDVPETPIPGHAVDLTSGEATAESPRQATGRTDEPPRDRLGEPSRAHRRRRRLFDPASGWFRGFERAASLYLSRAVFPGIPGLNRIYDAQVRENLSLSEADIVLRGLPRGFDGLRILLITDVHAGPFLSAGVLSEAFRRLNTLEPDLVLLGGDLTTSRLCEFESHRAAFESLGARHGVFAVLGNHDHYTGEPTELRRQVEAAGIRVLHNESVTLEQGEERLSLAGVDDLLRGTPDLECALAGTRSPVVLLSHNPDLFFDAARRSVGLMLSGHTHAGQIRFPGLPVLVRQSQYRLDEGRYRIGETELVVSRGLGAVGLPWRTHCPPEAVLLTLRRSQS